MPWDLAICQSLNCYLLTASKKQNGAKAASAVAPVKLSFLMCHESEQESMTKNALTKQNVFFPQGLSRNVYLFVVACWKVNGTGTRGLERPSGSAYFSASCRVLIWASRAWEYSRSA